MEFSRTVLRRATAGLAGAVLLATPGEAQAPRVATDFYITAAVAGFERPIEIRQSGLKQRVDVATGAIVQSFIADRTRGALIVMTAAGRRRLALLFPLSREQAAAPLPLDLDAFRQSQRLTRVGSSNVAGKPCAVYRYVRYLSASGTLCATAEGVVLQIKPDGRERPIYQATSALFARQDPKWFAPPPDYQFAALPGVGGAAPIPRPTSPAPRTKGAPQSGSGAAPSS